MDLAESLARAGRDPAVRDLLVAACLAIEDLPEWRHTAVRDELTGPVVDALHQDVGILRKTLDSGLLIDFDYRSKIARDFVLSVPPRPDHVWEPQTTRLALLLAAGARHVIVGGAYFGDQAIPLAAALAPAGGTCHAFEPDAGHGAMLASNAQLNDLSNLRVHREALWSHEGSVRLVGEDAYAGAVDAADSDGGHEVPATTIDAHLDREGIEHVGLILLDLEGGERAALAGARGRLEAGPADAPALIFEIHRSYTDWSESLERVPVIADVRRLGYTAFAVRDFQSNRAMAGRPIELVPLDDIHLEGPAHGFNIVAVKEPARLQGEQFAVVPGVSPKLLVDRDPALHHPGGGL